jgi:hypothetical protein
VKIFGSYCFLLSLSQNVSIFRELKRFTWLTFWDGGSTSLTFRSMSSKGIVCLLTEKTMVDKIKKVKEYLTHKSKNIGATRKAPTLD